MKAHTHPDIESKSTQRCCNPPASIDERFELGPHERGLSKIEFLEGKESAIPHERREPPDRGNGIRLVHQHESANDSVEPFAGVSIEVDLLERYVGSARFPRSLSRRCDGGR